MLPASKSEIEMPGKEMVFLQFKGGVPFQSGEAIVLTVTAPAPEEPFVKFFTAIWITVSWLTMSSIALRPSAWLFWNF